MVRRHNLSNLSQDAAAQAGAYAGRGKDRDDRGVALIVTLLLLFLMSVIGLAAVLSASSDLLINGYYSNYRGSFYAADSGMNVARQAMYNQLNSGFGTGFATFQTPPPASIATLASTVQTYINNNYGGGAPCVINPSSLSTKSTCYLSAGTATNNWANGAGSATNSWAESFNTTATVTLAPGSPTTLYTGTSISGYNYIYNYTLSFVMEEQAVFPRPGERSPQYDLAQRSAKLDPKEFPLLRRSGPILFDKFDRRYKEGLELMLRGAVAGP